MDVQWHFNGDVCNTTVNNVNNYAPIKMPFTVPEFIGNTVFILIFTFSMPLLNSPIVSYRDVM